MLYEVITILALHQQGAIGDPQLGKGEFQFNARASAWERLLAGDVESGKSFRLGAEGIEVLVQIDLEVVEEGTVGGKIVV